MNPSLKRLALVVLTVLAGTVYTVSSYLDSRGGLARQEQRTVEIAPDAPAPVLDAARRTS